MHEFCIICMFLKLLELRLQMLFIHMWSILTEIEGPLYQKNHIKFNWFSQIHRVVLSSRQTSQNRTILRTSVDNCFISTYLTQKQTWQTRRTQPRGCQAVPKYAILPTSKNDKKPINFFPTPQMGEYVSIKIFQMEIVLEALRNFEVEDCRQQTLNDSKEKGQWAQIRRFSLPDWKNRMKRNSILLTYSLFISMKFMKT